MSLWSGATKIDAVYLGGGGSGSTSYTPVNLRGGNAGRSGTASFVTNYVDDLLIMVLSDSATSTPQNPPAGWTRYPTWLSSSGLGNNFYSAIYYKFATTPQTTQSITGCDWTTLVFSGVNKTSPFGAYAQQENANTRNHTAPATTMTQTNSNALMLSLYCTKGASGNWTGTAAGYTACLTANQWNQWAAIRNDRTTAAVAAAVCVSSTAQPSFAHTIELLPTSRFVESGMAQAVFLGDVKVWPEFTAAETRYFTAGSHSYVVPAGASYLDVVLIGGGGGGDGSLGGLAADGKGGACGSWNKFSLAVGTNIQPGEVVAINVGAGGQGGTMVVPGSSAAGSATTATYRSTTVTATGGAKASMPGMTGGSGTLTYNGRTYRSGVGGASGSSSGNGGPGGSPGAGGGGGASLVAASPGGAGAEGGVWVYAY